MVFSIQKVDAKELKSIQLETIENDSMAPAAGIKEHVTYISST
jgi:hypothetical protein